MVEAYKKELGEIFMREDVSYIIQLMDRWKQGDMATIEEYEAIEPDLLLKFYPGEERRIDFCVCLQTKELVLLTTILCCLCVEKMRLNLWNIGR